MDFVINKKSDRWAIRQIRGARERGQTTCLLARSKGKPTIGTKSDHKSDQEIDQDARLIGFARFAVLCRLAVLAFDMREHIGSQRAAPSGETDFLGVALPAVRVWSPLSGFCMTPPRNSDRKSISTAP
jgi:hypothetical protein